MALEQKLSLKLSQRLVMTPSLQQAIKLLQMTRMELETTLAQELVENPVLEEIDEPAEEEEAAAAAAESTVEEAPAPVAVPEEKEIPAEAELAHRQALEELGFEAFFGDAWEDTGRSIGEWEDREAPPIENTLTREPDLYDHLLWQIHMSDIPPREREIAELVVGNLDADGFLVASAEEIAALASADASEPFSVEEVERVLALIRRLDPPGIACATLQESLLLQLDQQGADADPIARRIVAEHWDAFLKRQYPAIARALGLALADLEPAIEAIKCLETRPGRKFTNDRTHYIEPDVHVLKVGSDYVIQLNDDGLPRLRVSRSYRRMLQEMRAQGHQSEAQQFISEKMRSAVWLIKSLDQRQRTIYKVADSIVRQQRDFLDHGIDYLRPMVLRDVAEDIGMHESTVSRVVSNKYVHTPRGLFPLKFFFHSGIDRDYGEDISSLTVKRKIKQLIEAEDPRHPLSDSELMRILNREGIQIARRTVAKYRDELNLPSSADRRKIF
ncbi:MAG: RNA polymerase factor sigma-54 [Thermoanaerobaculia bacterium]